MNTQKEILDAIDDYGNIVVFTLVVVICEWHTEQIYTTLTIKVI